MKKFLAPLIAVSLMLSACASSKVIDGREYPTYGLIDQNENKSKEVCYSVSGGNIFWSIVLIETLIVPIWLIGYNLWEPEHKSVNGDCGIDARK